VCFMVRAANSISQGDRTQGSVRATLITGG
jgi:hypothetical protein